MKRKDLENLGLEKDAIDTIMRINGEDIEKAKSEAGEDNDTLKKQVEDLGKQVKERDKQLDDLKKAAGENEDLAKQIEDLQEENKNAAEKYKSEMNQLKLDFAVEKALTSAKAKNIKAVKALLDLEDAKFDRDGNVKGLQEQIDKLVAGEDTAFLFEAKKEAPKFKGFQPGASSQEKPDANVDFSKMTYDELEAYMNENPDA